MSDVGDWQVCKDLLGRVSRSFALPISFVPPDVEVALTVGYLLCRVADTIEDQFSIPVALRARLLDTFVGTLDGQSDAPAFSALLRSAIGSSDAPSTNGPDPELVLIENLDRVMRVARSQTPETQRATVRWVREMCSGMRDYTLRAAGADSLSAVADIEDLERYCYYVAGTVGHLVTDLFLEHMHGDTLAPADAELRRHAESFGIGLQLVNILKDVARDHARGRSFIPREVCARLGLEPVDLTAPEHRERAHECLEPLFACAWRHLDFALIYTLTIPPHHPQLRLFCLIPLWMAASTLAHAHGNDDLFILNADVKISRAEVLEILHECRDLVADDTALRERFAALSATMNG